MEPATAGAVASASAATPITLWTSAIPASTLSSTRPVLRPQSAGVGVRKPLQLTSNDRSGDSATPAARHAYTKPRPPSASSALTSTTASRRPRPQAPAPPHPNQTGHSRADNAAAIVPQILREEIETQCRVTRRAQRELNTLRVQRTAKLHEIALLQRHVQAFDVDAIPSPRRAATSTTTPSSASVAAARPHSTLDKLKDEIRRMDAYKKTLRSMLDRLARHQHFLRANTELLESQRLAAAREAALCQDKVAQDKSLCAELEIKRAQLASERAAHALHAQQLLASLRCEVQSRTRVSEQRQDADRRREEMLRLVESRPPESVHSAATPSTGHHQPPPLEKRHSHGRRDSFRMLMDESLKFFGASLPGSRTGSLDGSSPTAGEKTTSGIASTAAMAVAQSSRRLQTLRIHTSTAAAESLAAALHRETFFQVYETQYERILEQTGESDLAIVLERFRGFRETRARLEQIERDLAAEDAALDATRAARLVQLQQLRLSGIAEVEKRKKIRDFLEQQFLIKSAAREQAKEIFVEQLKTFSYVQQGILNITELLKCLDDKFSPPTLTAAVSSLTTTATLVSGAAPGAPTAASIVHRSVLTPAAAAEIDWLQSLLYSCRSVVRATASLSPGVDFTPSQVARLGEIDPTLGLAAGEWAVERLKHSIPGGNVVWRNGPGGQSIEDALDPDDDDRQDDSDDDMNDSDGEVEDRGQIKHKEAETLAQAELLIRTLDSRQQIAHQEQSMQRMRRAFGLGEVGEDVETQTTEPSHPLDESAKLAAVHAFFREKRLREKQEQQDRREMIAALGGMIQASKAPKKRGSIVGTPPANAMSGAVAMASIVAEMRAGSAVGRRPVTPTKSTVAATLTAFTSSVKPPQQRKRSNAVSFSVPHATSAEPAHPLKQLSATPKAPTRPTTPSSGTIMTLHRRGSHSLLNGQPATQPPAHQNHVGRPRMEPGQPKQR